MSRTIRNKNRTPNEVEIYYWSATWSKAWGWDTEREYGYWTRPDDEYWRIGQCYREKTPEEKFHLSKKLHGDGVNYQRTAPRDYRNRKHGEHRAKCRDQIAYWMRNPDTDLMCASKVESFWWEWR